MAVVRFRSKDGEIFEVEVPEGASLMVAGRDNGVPGMIGECGGWAACATCMVHVDSEWEGRLPEPQFEESTMLEGTIEARPNSRLGCQLRMDDSMDGLSVEIADN